MRNKYLFKIIIYIMIGAMLLSTILFSISFLIQ